MSDHDALVGLLTTYAWQKGPVTLASGKVSDFYINCKQALLRADGAQLVGRMVFDHVQKLRADGLAVEGVGGLTLGADPIAVAAALTSAQSDAPVHAFIIRKEPKGHGTQAWLEGDKNVPAGTPVLIVEDVVTTGGSTLKAVERAKESGLKPVAILTLVDREEGGREALEKTGLPVAALASRSDFR